MKRTTENFFAACALHDASRCAMAVFLPLAVAASADTPAARMAAVTAMTVDILMGYSSGWTHKKMRDGSRRFRQNSCRSVQKSVPRERTRPRRSPLAAEQQLVVLAHGLVALARRILQALDIQDPHVAAAILDESRLLQ